MLDFIVVQLALKLQHDRLVLFFLAEQFELVAMLSQQSAHGDILAQRGFHVEDVALQRTQEYIALAATNGFNKIIYLNRNFPFNGKPS